MLIPTSSTPTHIFAYTPHATPTTHPLHTHTRPHMRTAMNDPSTYLSTHSYLSTQVNLERSVAANGRMGGHFVQGHVDGTGKLVSLTKEDDSLWVKVGCSDELIKYIVEKGYITIDGTSLTVCDVNEEEGWFTIMLIQYTQGKVIIPLKQPGELVNLEVDIVGKYVARYMEKWDKAKARRSKL